MWRIRGTVVDAGSEVLHVGSRLGNQTAQQIKAAVESDYCTASLEFCSLPRYRSSRACADNKHSRVLFPQVVQFLLLVASAIAFVVKLKLVVYERSRTVSAVFHLPQTRQLRHVLLTPED